MKSLLLLRHAKSSWKDPERPDHDRPLNQRGKRDAPRMGAFLAAQRLVPDLILTSTARRARKTAKHAARRCGYPQRPRRMASLYLADAGELIDVLQTVPGKVARVLLVGHNPGLEELIEQLTGSAERLSTGALAQIELPIATWSDLTPETRGTLIGLWRPRELPEEIGED